MPLYLVLMSQALAVVLSAITPVLLLLLLASILVAALQASLQLEDMALNLLPRLLLAIFLVLVGGGGRLWHSEPIGRGLARLRCSAGASPMELSEHQILSWLGAFLWPFLRITGLFLTAPLFNSTFLPAPIKAALVFALAAALAFWLPDLPPFPAHPAAAVVQVCVQIAVGCAIGLVGQLMVSAVAAAGEMAGLSIGLSFAVLQFREAQGQTQALYDLTFWLGLTGYIVIGGPIWLFAALAHSFQAGLAGMEFTGWAQLADFGSVMFTSGVTLAAPVLATALSVNLVVGLMTVFAPQLNLLTIGFPTLILSGLATLAGSLVFFAPALQHLSVIAAQHLAAMLAHG